jgi:thioredoxin reductase (NADPH)
VPASSIPDIAVVGAGPCGIGVGIAAREAGLGCILFDKGAVAASLANYPTFMTFFSTAERLEMGGVPFTIAGDKPTRREAIRYYQRLADHFQLDVRQYHNVTAITKHAGRFHIHARSASGDAILEAHNIVIATGYFDHPNRLGVTGEELDKLRYGYSEGHPFFRQNVIIVGGGNSAVDAALELFRWKARVTIVHFGTGLDPGVKPWVLPDITGRIRAREISARFRTRIAAIRTASVLLHNEDSGVTDEIDNDWVLAMTGFTPDPALLHSAGVLIDPVTGIPAHDPEFMGTNVDGIFIAGVLAAGFDANKVFIENGRDHGRRIVGRVAARRGR